MCYSKQFLRFAGKFTVFFYNAVDKKRTSSYILKFIFEVLNKFLRSNLTPVEKKNSLNVQVIDNTAQIPNF